jgi:hypothetical protein
MLKANYRRGGRIEIALSTVTPGRHQQGGWPQPPGLASPLLP